jgi:hypothetical protein
MSTFSSTDAASASCTSAIDATRRTDSVSASWASLCGVRRACRRSSAATVCRLFFTRWWISRIVASLLSSARSRRRTSVTSRTSTSAPLGTPRGCSGSDRSTADAPWPSSSARCEGVPARAPRTCSAASPPSKASSATSRTTVARSTPTSSSLQPSRWKAEAALGLA